MELPARFGRYVLEERLATGGMAEVFRARLDEHGFQKPVCIKRILPHLAGMPGFADMLRDEASLAARLSHQHLVQALDFGSVDGTLFIAMELVEGTTLARASAVYRLAAKPFPIARALHIGVCVSRGLHAAHTATSGGKPLGVVHRDVSPQNVLLGNDGAIKVADFGVARATERISHTATGNVKGKPQYMAPEQALAEACDHRVDQFATAIVLWEALAGRDLFARKTVLATLDAVASAQAPPLSSVRADVGPALDGILKKALSLRAADRYPDMAAFERALGDELVRMNATLADIDPRPLVVRGGADMADPTLDDARLPVRPPAFSDVSDQVFLQPPSPRAPDTTGPAPSSPYDDDWNASAPTTKLPRLDATIPSTPAPGKKPSLSPTVLVAGGVFLVACAIAAVVITERPTTTAALASTSAPAPAPVLAPAPVAPSLPVAANPPLAPVVAPSVAPVAAVAPPDSPSDVDEEGSAPEPREVTGSRPRARSNVDANAVHGAIAGAKMALLAQDPARALEVLGPYQRSDDPDVHRLLGVTYAKLKQNRAAAHQYRRYLELKPDAPDAAQVREILKGAP